MATPFPLSGFVIMISLVFQRFCKTDIVVYPIVSKKDASSVRKRLLCSAIHNRNKELQQVLKELSISENFISKQLPTIDFYILKKSITSHNKKLLQKPLYIQHKKLSSLMRGCSLPIFTANETITNIT